MTNPSISDLVLDLNELNNKVFEQHTETKISLLKYAIQQGEYIIHPERIANQMLVEVTPSCEQPSTNSLESV